MSKKRYRIRWGRVAMLIAALVAIGIAIYYAVVGIVALFSWLISLIDGMIDSNRNEDSAPQVVSAYQQMDMTNGMTARIDSFMTLPTRLDKKNIAVEVYDLTTQQTTYFYQNRLSLVPASCMKIPTAIAALKKHYEGKRLLPQAFKDENHLQEIQGVYVPFWLFDTEAEARTFLATLDWARLVTLTASRTITDITTPTP